MTYTVTAAQLASITDPEIAFGTERLVAVAQCQRRFQGQ